MTKNELINMITSFKIDLAGTVGAAAAFTASANPAADDYIFSYYKT